MVEIAKDELLGDELVMRGGTCLHKVHLTAPRRYSEDLDYVRRTHSGIKPYVSAIRTLATAAGLEVASVDRSGEMVHVVLDSEPTVPPGRIRIKVETNIAETSSFQERIRIPYSVASSWWSGDAGILTYTLEELMSTKLRALYQRSQGRDLFDLWLVLLETTPDEDRIVEGFHHYMGEEAFTYPQLAQNLRAKLEDGDFLADIETLVTELPGGYQAEVAADVVMERLGSRLQNAPGLAAIESRQWRTTET